MVKEKKSEEDRKPLGGSTETKSLVLGFVLKSLRGGCGKFSSVGSRWITLDVVLCSDCQPHENEQQKHTRALSPKWPLGITSVLFAIEEAWTNNMQSLF